MGEAANRYRLALPCYLAVGMDPERLTQFNMNLLALAMVDALKVVVFPDISSREFGQNLREVQVANRCQVERAAATVSIRRKAEAAAFIGGVHAGGEDQLVHLDAFAIVQGYLCLDFGDGGEFS